MLDELPIEGGICAEVGVARGKYAAEILMRNPKKLYLIDLWAHQDKQTYPDKCNVQDGAFDLIYGKVERRFGSDPRVSIMKTLSTSAAKEFPDFHFDFVFIDANHIEEAVMEDLLAWYPKVKLNGWFCGHDFGNKRGVRRAVTKFCVSIGKTLDLKTCSQIKTWGIIKNAPNRIIKT